MTPTVGSQTPNVELGDPSVPSPCSKAATAETSGAAVTVLELADFNFFKFQQDSVYWRLKHGF